MKATVNLEGLHKLSSFHRRQVERAPRCGCFFCLEFFKPSAIEEWIDVRLVRLGQEKIRGEVTLAKLQKLPAAKRGLTALCPNCSIDAVIPDRTYGFRLTRKMLVALGRRYFAGKVSKREAAAIDKAAGIARSAGIARLRAAGRTERKGAA